MLKSIKIILNSIFALLLILLLGLCVAGGGWGRKITPPGHPLYSGALLLMAHRGVTEGVPENTLAAAERAETLEMNGIEIDIKESTDGQFYLFHDHDGQRLFHKPVELRSIPLDTIQRWPLFYNGTATAHRVPDLETFSRRFSERFIIYLDVKRHGNERYGYLADKIFDHLQRHQLLESAFVGSDFLFTAYLEFKYPQIHTVFRGPGDSSIRMYHWIPKRFRPDFIIGYAHEITPAHIKWLQKHQLMARRMLYGVNGDNYKEVRRMGIPKLLVDYHPVMQPDISQ